MRYEAYIQGAKDAEEIHKEENKRNLLQLVEKNINVVATEQKEQPMKYKNKTIHKHPKANTWYTRFRYNGKQFYISGKTQQECYINLKRALSSPIQQIEVETKLTLNQWFEKWLSLYKKDVKQETVRDYNNLMKNIEHLKDKEMESISVADILSILNSMSAERQKQKVYELLKMLFGKALDNEVITKNIMLKIEKPKHTKQNGDALTHQEEEIFINKCQNIKYGDLYLVALYQGLRKGEILGITDEDIDFENNTLTINKAINKYNKFDTTKNAFSIRTMPLFDKTKQILLKYKHIKGRIFNISYNFIDEYTRTLSKELNFHFSIKYMRFTFITRCQEANIPEFIIQAWCGHQIGSKVTKQVYTKYNAEDNTKYINILNNSKYYSNTTQK